MKNRDDLRTRTAGQWWDINEDYVTVRIDALRLVGSAAFQWAGASKGDAEYLFGFHMDKAMQGDHLRGIGQVPDQVHQAMLDARGEPTTDPKDFSMSSASCL